MNINAYHQPGVEAGKKAAAEIIATQLKVVAHLEKSGKPQTAEQIALAVEADPEVVFHILRHLVANRPDLRMESGRSPALDTFVL